MTEVNGERQAASRPARPSGRAAEISDNAGALGDLVMLIWSHKLWWLVPVIIAMLLLGALLVLQATPIGPLLYPVF